MNAKAVTLREIDLQKEVTKLLGSLNAGCMSGIAYDTAWLAKVTQEETSPFPWSLNWVSNNQREDGSWGGKIEYYQKS